MVSKGPSGCLVGREGSIQDSGSPALRLLQESGQEAMVLGRGLMAEAAEEGSSGLGDSRELWVLLAGGQMPLALTLPIQGGSGVTSGACKCIRNGGLSHWPLGLGQRPCSLSTYYAPGAA